MQKEDRYVLVGKVGAAHGIQGLVKITSYTEASADIFKYNPWHLKQNGQWVQVNIEREQQSGKHLIARVEGCYDRNTAQTLTNTEIAVKRDQLEELEEDQHYWSDLEGLSVRNTDGIDLGRVDHLFDTGSNAVMVITGGKRRLIPFIKEHVIVEVDYEAKSITVDWDPEF